MLRLARRSTPMRLCLIADSALSMPMSCRSRCPICGRQVHTNGLENFWSLLKRGINGTYVSIEPFHLFRYLDEQTFRYNNRATREKKVTDSDRFDNALSPVVGKRLTYAEVTGKVGAAHD